MNRIPPPFRRRANRSPRRLYLAMQWAIVAALAGWDLTRIDETELSTLLEEGADANLRPSQAQYLIVRSVGRRLRRPLVSLIDERSASTTEIFARGMQDLNRARIFGSTSAGAALPSTFERLPNGDEFQYAFADYTAAKGTLLEGHGVVTDEPVRHTRSALLKGRDWVLEAALRWIDQQQTAAQAATSDDRVQLDAPTHPSS